MKNPIVLVLMSTYNGERFLKEQIDSILSQEGVDVRLLVRDDGSTDRTWEILEVYASGYRNIVITRGENVGFVKSFSALVRMALDYSNMEEAVQTTPTEDCSIKTQSPTQEGEEITYTVCSQRICSVLHGNASPPDSGDGHGGVRVACGR